jgi:hypothetical protein
VQRFLEGGYEGAAADAEQDADGEYQVAAPLLGGGVDAGCDPGAP